MKLKALKPRLYNIMFHTHTVAGIVISFALFITFYAGAFSLFRDEIYIWENHQARDIQYKQVNSDDLLQKVTQQYPNFKKDGTTTIIFNDEKIPYIRFLGELDTEDKDNDRIQLTINPNTWEITDTKNSKTAIGETIYHLHYYRQIPVIGRWISGFVALFFLFAIVTGVLIHWKNMIRKFYAFSIKGKLKNLWTDAHTMLSIIGLPFQLVYALTGCLIGLLTLLLAPSVVILFNGSQDPIFENIAPQQAMKVNDEASLSEMVSLHSIYNTLQKEYPEHTITRGTIIHYGYQDATISFVVDDYQSILGDGNFTYSLSTGKRLASIIPNDKTYEQTIYNLMTKLHYVTYGGILLKIVYFILALVTCFSLISVANKLIPFTVSNRVFYENTVFFGGWLILIIIGLFTNDLKKLNNRYLLLGGIFSFFIPITNGLVTGDWFFLAFAKGEYAIASIDTFWLCTSMTALLVTYKIKNSNKLSE